MWKFITYGKNNIKNFNNFELYYSPIISLQKKIHICQSILPENFEIIIRKNKDLFLFDNIANDFYGDETGTPLEILINNIIQNKKYSSNS